MYQKIFKIGLVTVTKSYIMKDLNMLLKLYSVKHFTTGRYVQYALMPALCNSVKTLPTGWGTKVHKDKRKIPIQPLCNKTVSPEAKKQLEFLRANVKEQGDKIRGMKQSISAADDINKEVQQLIHLKKVLEEEVTKLYPVEYFDGARMSDLIKRSFLYDTSFAIYGGISGQCDFGPVGCGIVDCIVAEWQKCFVVKEKMMKINCSALTPESVFKASGHIERFTDYMVKDAETGQCFRLNHLIKYHYENMLLDKGRTEEDKKSIQRSLDILEGLSLKEMMKIVKEYNMKSPSTGNDITDALEFNLMFPLSIGPNETFKGYLRPETSQGIFVNFKRLYEFNQRKLPFACAQVGYAYRNEISPKSGLIRVREFLMAEIEHFCYPDDKQHDKFCEVEDTKLWLLSSSSQINGDSEELMTIGEAVAKGLVANETLGYYMARIQQFLTNIGIHPQKLRFRQHLSNEMAHYACDCWDAECLTSYGWIECVGCADRSAYDLSQHTKASGIKLTVEQPLQEPRTIDCVIPVMDRENLKNVFGKKVRGVQKKLSLLTSEQVEQMEESLSQTGEYSLGSGYTLTRAMIPSVQRKQKEVHVQDIIPSVIEPSFGIGRIFYALLEHTFRTRDGDENRTYFSLPPFIAPVPVVILPLVKKVDFVPFTQQLENELMILNIPVKVDDSRDSVGRRYSRADELSIPFAVTVDDDTVKDTPHTVTVRERDSTVQIRIPVEDVPVTIQQLFEGRLKWEDVAKQWPKFVFKDKDLH